MAPSATRHAVAPPDDHILTVQEALEPLFLALEEKNSDATGLPQAVEPIDARRCHGWTTSRNHSGT
jgi:hypothetical protein